MDGSKNLLSRSGLRMLPDQILPCRKWNSGTRDKMNCFQHSYSKLQSGFPVGLAMIDDTYLIHDSTEEPLTQTAGGGYGIISPFYSNADGKSYHLSAT